MATTLKILEQKLPKHIWHNTCHFLLKTEFDEENVPVPIVLIFYNLNKESRNPIA